MNDDLQAMAEADRHKSNTILAKVWVAPDKANALLERIRDRDDFFDALDICGFAVRISAERSDDVEGYGAVIEVMAAPSAEVLRRLALHAFGRFVENALGDDSGGLVASVEFV
jgi:hypothetical protein